MSAPDADPMDAAAGRADLLEGRPLVVFLSHAKRIRDEAVAAERERLLNAVETEMRAFLCSDSVLYVGSSGPAHLFDAEIARLRVILAKEADRD